MRAMDGWKILIGEIDTPSGHEAGPHAWATTALGHVMLGACFSFLPAIAVAIIYFAVKETRDLRKHQGRLEDSLVDTGFVWLGALYTGSLVWPLGAFLLVAVGISTLTWKDTRSRD